MKFTTIFVFLIPLVVARHHHRTLLETILKSSGNFFTKVNEDVQNVINNIFDSLNLEPTFPTKTRIKLLLTMHYDLNSISEENYDVYSNMINKTKIDNQNKTTNKIELYELIEEIFNDKTFNLSETVIDLNQTFKQATLNDLDLESTETDAEFEDSKEFMQFIQDFINKVDNISVNDFTKELPESPSDNSTDSNLEIWQPPAVLELDFVNDTVARRIYRGKKAKIKSFPFIVSIHLAGAFSCSGSIISADLIITAASCLQLLYNNRFFRENPRSLHVRIGSGYFIKGGEKLDVIETYFHPSYDPKTLHNNLVILRLFNMIRFARSQKRVKRILFDKIPQHLPSNTDGILILGWGSRKSTAIINQFQKLTVARLDIYPMDECAEIYTSHYVTDKHFCAGFLSTGGGACNRDVGGPGLVDGKLTGVVSFGPPVCGAVNAPTVFTKLGHYSNWIDSIMSMRTLAAGARTTLLETVDRRPVNVLKIVKFTMTPVNKKTRASTSRYTTDKTSIYTNHTTGTYRTYTFKAYRTDTTDSTETTSAPASTILRHRTRESRSRTRPDIYPPVHIGVRTTLIPEIVKHVPIMPQQPTRMSNTPVATESYRAQMTGKSDDLMSIKSVLKELSETNDSILYELLYGDGDEDFHDIFKPTEKVNDIEHPLVNKSLYMIPDIHTFGSNPSNYVTIPLTTSSSTLPPTTTPESTRDAPVTTHAPVTSPETSSIKTEVHIERQSNKEEHDSKSEYDFMSTQSELQAGKEDELAPNQKYYSYEETTPIVRMNKRHSRHRHQRRRHKKRRQRLRRHKHSGRGRKRNEGGKHHGITPVNDLDNHSSDEDYDEDRSYHTL